MGLSDGWVLVKNEKGIFSTNSFYKSLDIQSNALVSLNGFECQAFLVRFLFSYGIFM